MEKLLALMGEDFIDASEMMKLCNIVRRKTILKNYIAPALADGTIERKFPNQPTRPDQMYRLTGRAAEWKKENDR